MIFRRHGQPLFASIERRTFRYSPGLQYAVAFKPEIEVQTPGGVLLDDKEQRAAASYRYCGNWLGCGFERTLGRILAERCGFGRAGVRSLLAFRWARPRSWARLGRWAGRGD